MKEKALVVLAAGMGSRFGGLKQIEPVGPNNEFIIDYSIYSAIKYGFNKIVFVIKEENYEVFKNTIGSRISKYVSVSYAFQKLSDVPVGTNTPSTRTKPLGTAHALYAAREYLTDNFGIITSDDFYGDDAFRVLSNHLSNSDNSCVVGYKIGDTLSDNGAVKRGVIISDNNKINSIIESSCIKEDKHVTCTPLNKSIGPFTCSLDNPVSMLMNGFSISIMDMLETYIRDTLNNAINKDECEVLLPDIMDKCINLGQEINLINTSSKWMGMTYKSDEENVKNYIKKQIEEGVYPEHLW